MPEAGPASKMTRRWGIATVFACAIALTACGERSGRAACMETLVSKPPPGLRHGMAVFDDVDGRPRSANGDPRATLRARARTPLRAASLTKPIIAHEMRRLVAAGRLRLDAPLPDGLVSGTRRDASISRIRLRNLLQHTAGFDRSVSFDPLWRRDYIDFEQPDCDAATRHVLPRSLDFAPGERVAYSNVGYCILGQWLTMRGIRIESELGDVLKQPAGGAGGWTSTLPLLHARLSQTLPLGHIKGPGPTLADGSHYDYGWRHWPDNRRGPPWTHFGRLPGMLSLAVSDGESSLVVAYFDGDIADVDGTSLALSQQAWRCMQQSR